MTISPKHTIRDICLNQATIFTLGNDRVYKEIKELPKPIHLRMKRRLHRRDKIIPARDLSRITMQELDQLSRTDEQDYFIKVLCVMLKISEPEAMDLYFIRAYRYFLECMNDLGKIAKKWKSLEMPLTPEEQQAHIEHPNRGIVSICRQYAQLMNGAVKFDDTLEMPWHFIYEAFEAEKYKNLEMRRLQAIYSNKGKSRKK